MLSHIPHTELKVLVRRFVLRRYPELRPHFDTIWKVVQDKRIRTGRAPVSPRRIGGASLGVSPNNVDPAHLILVLSARLACVMAERLEHWPKGASLDLNSLVIKVCNDYEKPELIGPMSALAASIEKKFAPDTTTSTPTPLPPYDKRMDKIDAYLEEHGIPSPGWRTYEPLLLNGPKIKTGDISSSNPTGKKLNLNTVKSDFRRAATAFYSQGKYKKLKRTMTVEEIAFQALTSLRPLAIKIAKGRKKGPPSL